MEEINGNPAVEIMRIVVSVDKETGEKNFGWKFSGIPINDYMLIGLLDHIKHEILEKLHGQTVSGVD
jgi:hypothetical protein